MAGTLRAWGVFLLLAMSAFTTVIAAPPAVRLPDLDNKLVDPFAGAGRAGTVFLFTSIGCPYSNRYAPELRRLYDQYSAKGFTFWLVYPNPRESTAQIRKHLKDYGYPMRVLRDPTQELVKATKVQITPEAAVYDTHGDLVYHGRIDNRYVSIGVERPAPTEQELQTALASLAAGKPVTVKPAPAVGCFIVDFLL